uniref:Uncharacterized protein n=1 Tax=Tanacetum cinerariifolium TaxID=118510 RepID=A0A699HPI4_TANCI|nr:hypothetical protein [Tanacetum cinerariifolium]
MQYLVKISKKARILELKQRYLKITLLTPNTPYPSMKIRRIDACTSQKTTKKTRSIRCLRKKYRLNLKNVMPPRDKTILKVLDNGGREEGKRIKVYKFNLDYVASIKLVIELPFNARLLSDTRAQELNPTITMSNSYVSLGYESDEDVENVYDESVNLFGTKTSESSSTFTAVAG